MAQGLQQKSVMKILLISNDIVLIEKFRNPDIVFENIFTVYDKNNDLLDIMSFVLDNHPSVMIVDDDFLKPNSARIISSIKNALPKISIIFVTSDDSHTLGREISPLGIQYYAIKPVDINDMKDLIASIAKIK